MPDPLFFAAESYVGTTHLGHYLHGKGGGRSAWLVTAFTDIIINAANETLTWPRVHAILCNALQYMRPLGTIRHLLFLCAGNPLL